MKLLKSKYEDLDIENLPDEEYDSMEKKIYIDIITRCVIGVLVIIISIALLLYASKI